MKGLALALLGLILLILTPWIIARLGRRYGSDDLVIPPLSKERYLYLNADESLRERTAKKRQAADVIRTRAAKVESGSPVSEILRRVK